MRLPRFAQAIVSALVMLLVLAGCAPVSTRPSTTETAAVQDAAALARSGHFDAAAQAYLALADANRARADYYRLLAAESWRQGGELDRAAPTLQKIDRSKLAGDAPLRLDLLRAERALDTHNLPEALRLTIEPQVAVPAALRPRLLELRARALAADGDHWGSARTRAEMQDQLSGFDRQQNQQQIVAQLAMLGADPLKRRAAAMQAGDRMLPWINAALASLGVTVVQPPAQLQRPVGTLLPGANANVREGYKVPEHMALLLPLDGAYAAVGTSVAEGFFAAYFDAGREQAPRPAVRVYSTHSTPGGALSSYQQALDDGAQLVVGPLTRDAVAALFKQSRLPVPTLALNHPDNRRLPAGDASEFGLMPETEGAQAAAHMIERGLRHAYTVVSSLDFSQRALTAFKAEYAARGGTLLGGATFESGGTAIAGLNLANAPEDAGVFISMRPAQARVLVPQLRAAKVQLPVVATSHVYDGSDDAASNRDLDGVEFCEAPWLFNAQPGLPPFVEVEALLPSARGATARLFAFGMDAWNLVPYLDWLRNNPGSYLPGATGQLTSDQFGRIRRVLTWAVFTNGTAHPLEGSLQMDNVPSAAPPEPGQIQALPVPASSVAPPTGSSVGAPPEPVAVPVRND